MKVLGILALALLCYSTSSFAGDCELTIKRSACPGKETAAFKPYNGKDTTVEKKPAADAAACKTQAEAAAKIVRAGTLSKKEVSAKFDGADAGSASDEKACK